MCCFHKLKNHLVFALNGTRPRRSVRTSNRLKKLVFNPQTHYNEKLGLQVKRVPRGNSDILKLIPAQNRHLLTRVLTMRGFELSTGMLADSLHNVMARKSASAALYCSSIVPSNRVFASRAKTKRSARAVSRSLGRG